MKIIIAPDKFKGSLTSEQACKSIAAGILQVDKDIEIIQFPMADGGDGFAAVLQYYLHTQTIIASTVDPLMRMVNAAYQWEQINRTAIIELAAASGMELLQPAERDPLYTSTYGTGLQILNAVQKGAEKIILGLGGSSTNDAGIGILAALGFQLLDANENVLPPVGDSLQYIKKIIPPLTVPNICFEIACDVTNILYGSEGAAFVYAAQKGADARAIEILDKGLQQFANAVKEQTGKDIASFAGAGAAGGVAAGLAAYFDTTIINGAKLVADAGKIEDDMKGAGLIITGEGKLDNQSSKGKVVQHIAALGNQHNVPVMALCGIATISEQERIQIGLSAVYSLVNNTISKDVAVVQAGILLSAAAEKAVRSFLNDDGTE